MDVSRQILSDITVHMKYARYLPELGRRESFEEIVTRNMEMHIRKYPHIEEQIRDVYERFVYTRKVLPSMRSLQFGGKPIELSNSRMFNCAYLPLDSISAFSEVMFLLLGGTGVGYSVQKRHVSKLPEIHKPTGRKRRFLVADNIEGWADAIKVLMKSYTKKYNSVIDFDFGDIRPKGERLITSGGKAPGPQPLKDAVHKIKSILDSKEDGSKLTPIECHDICCHIADCVLSGGIRRAAMISLFSHDDTDMAACKSGSWWELNPQRGRANNSAVLHRQETDKYDFLRVWDILQNSGSGEPGFLFVNDWESGTNPCCEISLTNNQMCNLTEIGVSDVYDQEEFNQRCYGAAFIGTLQAGYTNFHYLRPIWQENCEKEALLGVSMTGIASDEFLKLDLKQGAEIAKNTNIWLSEMIGINPSARVTTVKPAGTTSLVLGSSSGIHAWHDEYYIRRIRVGKDEAIYSYLSIYHPELIEDEFFNPEKQAVISVPQKAPEGAITRYEGASSLLDRIKRVYNDWVKEGHNSGVNTHNVSATVSVKDDEWEMVRDWMWENRENYNGISILPYDGGTYIQAPFETTTKERYEEMFEKLSGVDLSKVVELDDNTSLTDQAACAGGNCEIK